MLGPHTKGQRQASAQDTVFRQVISLSRSVGQTVSICINWHAVLINDPFSGLNTTCISLSSSLTITNQSIGAASNSQGFENVDGLLELGPAGLTYGTLTDQPNSKIPTINDNLSPKAEPHPRSLVFPSTRQPPSQAGMANSPLAVSTRASTLALSRTRLSHRPHERSTTGASTNQSCMGLQERPSSERQPESSTPARHSCSLQATLSADTRISLGQGWMVRRVSLVLRLPNTQSTKPALHHWRDQIRVDCKYADLTAFSQPVHLWFIELCVSDREQRE